MRRWRKYLNLPASARIGILLAVLWLLCRWGTERANDSLVKQVASFWWNIGVKLDPTHRDPTYSSYGYILDGGVDGWFVVPIVGSVLFILPIAIEWAIRPVISRVSSSRRGIGQT